MPSPVFIQSLYLLLHFSYSFFQIDKKEEKKSYQVIILCRRLKDLVPLASVNKNKDENVDRFALKGYLQKRENERERERDRERERQREIERGRERQRDTERDRERQRKTETKTNMDLNEIVPHFN